MLVAAARLPQRLRRQSAPALLARHQIDQAFDQRGDLIVGDPVIAKPSLRPHREHARVHELLQMSARTLRRNAGHRSELAGRKCPAVRQRTHHCLPRGITERLRYFRKARLHRPIKHSGQASAAIEVPREPYHTPFPAPYVSEFDETSMPPFLRVLYAST